MGRGTFSFAMTALALSLAAAPADARHGHPSWGEVHGPFTSTLETGPGCIESTSIPQMCTHGLLQGDLEGTYEFSFETLTTDPRDPLRTNYTGHSVITIDHGKQLFGRDFGSLRVNTTTGKLDFLTIVTIVGGTSEYVHAGGVLAAGGQIDPQTNAAIGRYDGVVVKAH